MPEPTPPVRLLSLSDLQRKLGGLSRTSVWALRRSPGFPAPVKLGNAPRYVESEIDAWLLKQPRQTAQDASGTTNGGADDQGTADGAVAV